MKKYFIVLLLLSQVLVAQNTTTIYLIRHAEKENDSKNKNPNLSEMGLMRASHWDDVFSEVHFDAIYSTNYNRTQQTAEPTALTQKMAITTYNPKDLSLDTIQKKHSGQTILIVGHSNTIPELVNQLIGQNRYPIIEETTFGNLYIVTINGEVVHHQLLKSL